MCVRSAAISCLGELGLSIPDLKDEIASVLFSFKFDIDSEVRERVAHYLNLEKFKVGTTGEVYDLAQILEIESHIKNSLENLETVDIFAMIGFDLSVAHDKNRNVTSGKVAKGGQKGVVDAPGPKSPAKGSEPSKLLFNDDKTAQFNAMQEFFRNHETFGTEEYGALRNSSEAKPLIDKEAEYFTTVRKHMFTEYVVLEFVVTNNDEEHEIRNVEIDLEIRQDEDLQIAELLANERIAKGSSGSIFVSLAKNPDPTSPVITNTFTATLKFTAVLEDSDGIVVNEYDDDYPFDEVIFFHSPQRNSL